LAHRYYVEDWLRGEKGDLLKEAARDPDIYHPHITFVRPFSVPEGNEDKVKQLIIDYCKDRGPINFTLNNKDHFPQGVIFIPVVSRELSEFNDGLEKILEPEVKFDVKLADQKTLHLTITNEDFFGLPETVLPMLRLTVIRDKKIWFSWDFELHRELNREESLDKWAWGLTKAFYYDDLHPLEPNPFIQDIREAIYVFESGDPGDEFAGVGERFYLESVTERYFGGDMSFYEEVAPTVFNYFGKWLETFSDREDEKKDMRKYDNLMAFHLSNAFTMAVVSGSNEIMERFNILKEKMKAKQTNYGRALTEYMIGKLKRIFIKNLG
jgi:2'-5' RNA ligase